MRTYITLFCLAAAICFAAIPAEARHKKLPTSPLYVSFIDQLPSGAGPAINGLDERRRGPIFNAALQQVVHAGKLPTVVLLNKDLSLPETVTSAPRPPAGSTLLRITITQWRVSPLGGPADTEIQCRLFAEVLRDGKIEQKLGPFFARRRYDFVIGNLPEDRWEQFQAAARAAIEQMADALGKS